MAKKKQTEQDCPFPIPRKQVLLLSCMDLRLLDDTVEFMNHLNLANRYDQLVFAGAALGVNGISSPGTGEHSCNHLSHWKDVFFHHLQVAIDVLKRNIKDIFILEHRDCGAYENFHPTHNKPYCENEFELEEEHHREQAFLLAHAIEQYCREQEASAQVALEQATAAHRELEQYQAEIRLKAWQDIRVHCFLMDLDGTVKHLCEGKKKKSKRPSKSAKD